jgi:TM2 domain-containing membrane protein YozV
MDPSKSLEITGSKRPVLAALLQILPFIGGAGYFYLGQHRKGLLLALTSGVLLAGNMVAASLGLLEDGVVRGWVFLSMVLTPLWFSLLLVGGLDAWLLGRELKAGGSVGVRESRVPLAGLLLGQSGSETQNG